MLEVSEKCLSGKGPLDGHASNRPEFSTMDGMADRMIAGRQYGHSASVRTLDQRDLTASSRSRIQSFSTTVHVPFWLSVVQLTADVLPSI
jgi:hypothetical protein